MRWQRDRKGWGSPNAGVTATYPRPHGEKARAERPAAPAGPQRARAGLPAGKEAQHGRTSRRSPAWRGWQPVGLRWGREGGCSPGTRPAAQFNNRVGGESAGQVCALLCVCVCAVGVAHPASALLATTMVSGPPFAGAPCALQPPGSGSASPRARG